MSLQEGKATAPSPVAKPKVVVFKVTIEEEEVEGDDTGWLMTTAGKARRYKTAMHAFRAVQRMGKRLAVASAVPTIPVSVVEWTPRSRVGRMVVRAIAGEGKTQTGGKV